MFAIAELVEISTKIYFKKILTKIFFDVTIHKNKLIQAMKEKKLFT
jgi:hypothetical protein